MVWLVVVVIILLIMLSKYNQLIKLNNKVNQAKSGIDIYLNQRFDLIPNLVECVKAYSKHESEIFMEIANLRNMYNKQSDISNGINLNSKMNKLIFVAENYPELKADEQYLNLQKRLSKIESQLQAARRIYNMEVMEYNNKLKTIPSNIIAKIFRFNELKFFEIENYKKENIKLDFKD